MKQYEKSVTSQWGEDGVIEEIFNRIGTENRYAVEVGAWDGKHFSNTWTLGQKNWRRILAEADPERFKELQKLQSPYVSVYGKCDNIDAMLDQMACPDNIDLLSIDIDGDDYYLWKDMVKYKPRVVVIEYNQTVPPGIGIVQERGGMFGASFEALMNLAEEKGYSLVHITTTNLIFVVNEYYKLFDSPCAFVGWFPDDWIMHVVIGYNGKRYLIGQPAHNDNQAGKHEKLITDVKIEPI